MDKAQLLVFTRQPDLFQRVEIIGLFVLMLTTLALWRRLTDLSEKTPYFIAASALAPFLVFNQQILTGRSLQPFHYEYYVINYVVMLAVVLIITVFWQKSVGRIKYLSFALLTLLSGTAVGWGFLEARETTIFWDDINVRRDEAMPVNLRLRELAAGNIEQAKKETTLNLEALQADSQPTVAPQGVVWARHQHVFSGLKDWEENKKRYYQLLYYMDLDEEHLRNALTGCRDIEACMALFGWDRFNAKLSANARPLTQPEVEAEVKNYADFVKNFSLEDARHPQISYVIVYNEAIPGLENFDRWYERDEGEVHGQYTLYRAQLRKEPKE